MALSNITDIRKLDDQGLVDEILATKRQLFDLRMQRATKQEPKPHEFKHTRHRLAQLVTVEHERKLGLLRPIKDSN